MSEDAPMQAKPPAAPADDAAVAAAVAAILARPGGAAAILALQRQLDGLERERGANSVEAREAAQQEVLDAAAALAEATGVAGMKRRRLSAFIGGKVAASPASEAALFRALAPGHLNEDAVLKFFARLVLDARVLPKHSADGIASFLHIAHGGRRGPIRAPEGHILSPRPRPGVHIEDTGAAEAFRNALAYRIGYEAGLAIDSAAAKPRATGAILSRAQKQWRQWAAKLDEPPPAVPAPETIRSWLKDPGQLRDQYMLGVQAGQADRAGGTTRPEYRLP